MAFKGQDERVDYEHSKKNLGDQAYLKGKKAADRGWFSDGPVEAVRQTFIEAYTHFSDAAKHYAHLKMHKDAGRAQRLAQHAKQMSETENHAALGNQARAYKLATASIILLLGSLLFLSPSITGNAIGNMAQTTTSSTGIILFVLGIAVAFVYFKSKK